MAVGAGCAWAVWGAGLFLVAGSAGAAPISQVWVADQGDGTYKNPILHADYSDPDVVRVGDDFYLVASSFQCAPGLPILHSRDLVNWTLINHALPRLVAPAGSAPAGQAELYATPQNGKGVWAPSIRFHGGEFYLYYPDPDFGVWVTRAKDPAGAWSAPVLVVPGKGIIDPCPLFAADGKVYLVHAWAGSRSEIAGLLTMRRLSADGMSLAEPAEGGRHVFDGHEQQPGVEGPKLYERNGYYYIFAPAGGVPHGWQLVLRAREIYGPYEERVVLRQGKTETNGPHQGGWVQTAAGEDWFLHFQDKGAYGRVVHLEPMHWEQDWPVIGEHVDAQGAGEPVARHAKPRVGGGGEGPVQTPQEDDEFNGDAPGLQWQWNANPNVLWSAEIPESGFLRLFAMRLPPLERNLWRVPNLLLQKFPAPTFTATTRLRLSSLARPKEEANLPPEKPARPQAAQKMKEDAGKRAAAEAEARAGKQGGLLVMGADYSALVLRREKQGVSVVQVICRGADKCAVPAWKQAKGARLGPEEKTIAQATVKDDWVELRVQVAEKGICTFSYRQDGEIFKTMGQPFAAKQGYWIGARVGLFCTNPPPAKGGGYVDVDWFRLSPERK